MRACLWALILAAAAAGGDDVSVVLEWEPGYLGHWRYVGRPLLPQAPAGLKPPAGITEARFGTLELHGGRRVHFALDVGSNPQRLWVDADRDGDLAEEAPREWKGTGSVITRATIQLHVDAAGPPLPVDFTFWRTGADNHAEVKYLANVHRAARVVLAGRVRKVALVDGNGDFRFDDPEHDRIFVDVDGSGRLGLNRGSHEQITIGVPFHVRGQGFVATVADPFGGRIEFREVKPVPPPRPRFLEKWDPPAARTTLTPPKRTLRELEKAYEAGNQAERIGALKEVGRIGSREAFDFLHKVATSPATSSVRLWAIDAMGYQNYAAQAARLGKLARSKDEPKISRMAVWSLHYMQAKDRAKVFAAVLKAAGDKETVTAASATLAYIGTPGSRKSIVQAFRACKIVALRREIYRCAKHADPGGLPRDLVKAALEDTDDKVRGDALWDYWGLDPAQAREVSYRILEQKKVGSASLTSAIDVVGFHGDKRAVEPLLHWAEVGRNWVWQRVLSVLTPVRGPRAVRAIALGVKHKSSRIRSLCAHVLEDIPAAVVTGALVDALRKEKEPDVQWRLTLALTNQTDDKAVAELLRLARLKDFPAASRSIVLSALARTGFRDPKVAKLFLGLLSAPRWEDRVFALDAVARTGDPAAAPKILGNLGHKVWQVRLAAVQALRRVRVVEAIPALIDRLDSEEERRIRIAIADVLYRLTAREFYDDADGWRRWWTENRAAFRLPEQVKPRGAPKGGTGAQFYGVPVYSDRVCFVLDKSGSMDALDTGSSGTRLARATTELLKAVEKLRKGARGNVIFFGSRVEPWEDHLVPLGKGKRDELRRYLEKLEPKGKTNLFDALELALKDKEVDTIFLLSDGAPTGGRFTQDAGIQREIRALNRTRRVAIHTISLGRDSNLLRALANDNDGTYVRR